MITGSDRYPSRQTTEVTLFERQDPVVYGAPEDGPLDRDLLDEFDSKGFIHLPDLFAPGEVQSMLDELSRLSGDSTRRADERTIIEPEADEVRSIFEIHAVSDLFRRVVGDPRVADVARQILGSEVYLHQTRVNSKPGFAGKEFMWHSDFETWHVEDGMPAPRALSASITLTDNHTYNGPLMIMPGSHWTYVTCVGETPEQHYKQSLKRQEIGVPDHKSLTILAERHGIEPVTGAAGGVIFFDCNCMHGSNSNITPDPRANVFAVYNSVDNGLDEPYGPDEPRPAFVAAREVSPLPRTQTS